MVQSHAERWLRAAQNDLETAKVLLNNKQYNACAFYSQQTAEKALKALLFSMNQTAWGHSNKDLLDAVESQNVFGNHLGMSARRSLDSGAKPVA